ncbi:MAG: hypothetical protein H6559_29965 [Lewinellaceae bacterium]|nr:hypothetical protein [Lewinellaceae bacterium]
MNFEKETETTGDFEWVFTETEEDGTGYTERESGVYEIVQDGKAIHLLPLQSGELTEETLSLEAEEKELAMQGLVDGGSSLAINRAVRD